VTTSPRLLLGLAAVAVGFAAADTYVVVLALPDMMAGAGLAVDELQRAAPIVSGFLLGYVAMLPLIGRIADLRGRVPVLVGSLVVFALGSLVTAASYDLTSMVAGRFLQGVGGGGLVPATLALVADMYPPSRRGVPLGVVGAVQELGSVLGPLYGALVLAVADWEAIFWINLAVGLVLAAALSSTGSSLTHRTSRRVAQASTGHGAPPPDSEERPRRRREVPDPASVVLAALGLVLLTLVLLEPAVLTTGVTSGLVFLPVVGGSRWLTPVALVLFATLLALVVRSLTAPRPLLAL
jgi:MFS family permease